MEENLVIVESPAKAKTIEKFLGKSFLVKSSFGHIRDLSKKNQGINVENNFEPEYEIPEDKKKVVDELKKLAKQSKTVWLASDEDREGEAISWHLYEVLGLKPENTKRIVFHEITKEAILRAVDNPRVVDMNLVYSQQARRVLDRLVGFEISPILWRKVKPSLSAGRVQSVAVRLLVEREREVINFKPESFFKVSAFFIVRNNEGQKSILKAELPSRFDTMQQAEAFLSKCNGAKFAVDSVTKKPSKKSPAPPFTTSTLQQEASRKLGFSVAQTMSTAQRLYEAGFITYMRTDSVNLSEAAIANAKNEISSRYGAQYSNPKNFKTKTKGAQEAHEAIRPSYIDKSEVSAGIEEMRLYELIWKRTIASQMSDAELEKTTISISISGAKEYFQAVAEIVKFDGFLKVYRESSDDENEEDSTLLPPLKTGDELSLDHISAMERFTQHLPRYTEASLVKKLEELGIGRPSTYAPTISTIQTRGYVIRENREGTPRDYSELVLKAGEILRKKLTDISGAEKAKLFPTDIGIVVNDFLVKYFKDIIEYNFTADVEKQFDEIAEGNLLWNKMISTFYDTFHPNVEKTMVQSERTDGERFLGNDPVSGKPVIVRIGKYGPIVQIGESVKDDKDASVEKPKYASLPKGQLIESITLEQAIEQIRTSNEGRVLGVDPKSGRNIVVRIGKFGPMLQIGDNDDAEKPIYSSLPKGKTMSTVVLEDALEMFKLPRVVGEFEGKNISASLGKFGPFLSHDGKFVSLKSTDDPLTVTVERAVQLILDKRESDVKKMIKSYPENPDISLQKDRWGRPCIFYKKKYFKLPPKVEPADLSYEACLKLMNLDPETIKEKPKTTKTTKASAAKKTTASAKTKTKKA